MSELIKKASSSISTFKDVIMFLYSALMILTAFVLVMEAKLYFELNIPGVDLPFDEWYQRLVGKL